VTSVLQVEYVGDLDPYDYEIDRLSGVGASLTVARCADGDELARRAAGADVIWLEWTPHLTRAVLERLPRCGLVMRWGVGYDQIDVAAATELGIAVANAPSYCTEDVAEHAIGLLLSVSRQIVMRHEQMRAGLWRAGPVPIRRIQGSTVGVVGLGRIGRRVAELAGALGARVLGADPVAAAPPGVQAVDLATLLAESDFVTLHVPMSGENRHLIDADTLGQLKPGAVLVNTSRGGVVDQAALLEALASGQLGGAALDVFETEPLPADSPLRAAPNLVITCHEAANSERSLGDLRREICSATLEWLTTGWAASIVNPEIRGRERGIHGV
jgi:D-3-phosphoglycerate dehydrogenase